MQLLLIVQNFVTNVYIDFISSAHKIVKNRSVKKDSRADSGTNLPGFAVILIRQVNDTPGNKFSGPSLPINGPYGSLQEFMRSCT